MNYEDSKYQLIRDNQELKKENERLRSVIDKQQALIHKHIAIRDLPDLVVNDDNKKPNREVTGELNERGEG